MDVLKFIIPSIVGILLFMVPLSIQGEITIPVALLASWVQSTFAEVLPEFITVIIMLTAVITVVTKAFEPAWILERPFLKELFGVSTVWFWARIAAAVFVVMTFFGIGPEFIWSDATGGLLFNDLIPALFAVFLFAGLLLPLLLDFGLLELCGALLTKIMKPIFTLPGRSSIDCLASWLGDGTIGILLTNKQYEGGFYTKREAAVIGTTFSVVSITFTIVVLTLVDLQHMFFQYYLTIIIAGLAAALICPRIPPLSRKTNQYYEHADNQYNEKIPGDISSFKWGISQAVGKAKNTSWSNVIKGGGQNVLDMWMGVIPIVMAIGTIALIVAEYTPVFEFIGAPFIPLLQLMQVPEAAAAAPTMVVGFADMFLPAVLGSGIESPLTRFVIACVSVTQLIYMSEVGGLLLGSKLPVKFMDLVIIFLERTLITLPIVVLMAHLFF
ncbi:YjiH family protein [Halobacillus shinanisalinarum]|uniref:YjiH family protein n=2 Tax=Halobacillus shinanisalinarum TaxID=2932258 RepID=A0ABY4H6H2_9BACI|nr:YjiH family protein [Halobacillus shinanisalinarum]UOQ95718.1 YjiH family protein [Halobacillus shinanisalinarum]